MSQLTAITATSEGVLLRIHTQPGARHRRVVGLHGDRLKLSVTAAPQRGAANSAVVSLLAELLGVPDSSITLVRGQTSRQKDFAVADVSVADAKRLLLPDADA